MEEISAREKKWFAICVLLALSLYFSFGFYHIDKFETADEHYWIYFPNGGRVHQYWKALKDRNWSGTYINDKPGVTVALVSGVGLLFRDAEKQIAPMDDGQSGNHNPEISRFVFRLFKIPIMVFNGLFSLIFLWLIIKLTKNWWLSLWGWMLILFSPVLLGISQIVNPDSLVWSFAMATFLSFLLLLETEEKKYVLLTVLFFGLSLLTKYVAFIFLPFFIVAGLVKLWFIFEENPEDLSRRMKTMIFHIIFIVFGAAILFVLFIPGVFWQFRNLNKVFDIFRSGTIIACSTGALLGIIVMDALLLKSRIVGFVFEKTQGLKKIIPVVLYLSLLSVILLALINWMKRGGVIFPAIYSFQHDLERGVGFRRKEIFDQLLLELRLTVFSITPMVLLGLVWLLLKGIFNRLKRSFWLLYSVIFILAFYAAMVQQELLITMRYGIMLYPILAFLGAWGINEIFPRFRWREVLFTIIILGGSSYSLWLSSPFYFNYENSLLKDDQVIADAWGYGGYEAAMYLNSLPDAQNLKVWADYRGFCPFFKGICISERQVQGERDDQVDYFIKTRRGSIIFKSRWQFLEQSFLEDESKPLWQKIIGDRAGNYIKIYKSFKD